MLRARQDWQQHLAEAEHNRSLSGGFVALLDLVETRLSWFVSEADNTRSFAFELPCYIAAVRARYPDEDILNAIEMLMSKCVSAARNLVDDTMQAQGDLTEAVCDRVEFHLAHAERLWRIRDLVERARVAETDPHGWSAWAQRLDRWTCGSLSRHAQWRAADRSARERR